MYKVEVSEFHEYNASPKYGGVKYLDLQQDIYVAGSEKWKDDAAWLRLSCEGCPRSWNSLLSQ